MIAGIILAAGKSSRMGRIKQLLPLDGKPLLQHAIDAAAAAALSEVIVVLGHEAERIAADIRLNPGARIAVSREYASGAGWSLAAGLQATSPEVDAAVILLGDQPGISPAIIDAAIALYRRSGARVVRAIYGEEPGHPVLLDRSIWKHLIGTREEGGARLLIERHPEWVIPLVLDPPPPPDVDTWESYWMLATRISHTSSTEAADSGRPASLHDGFAPRHRVDD
ncbi:MAG TPA: nucleotidyltransferase family protein [Thermoanaerobaculia bacterium]|nr:nucleotidyltransferase family protein [Thermoanaerobaculia bacterium]